MIDTFANDINQADHTFLGQQSSEKLANMTGVRPIKLNARMKRHVSDKKYKARTSFHARIQQEIFDAKTDSEKRAIQRDLDSLAHGENEEVDNPIIEKKVEKPELTSDYLRSIGREDLIEWGTGRDE